MTYRIVKQETLPKIHQKWNKDLTLRHKGHLGMGRINTKATKQNKETYLKF